MPQSSPIASSACLSSLRSRRASASFSYFSHRCFASASRSLCFAAPAQGSAALAQVIDSRGNPTVECDLTTEVRCLPAPGYPYLRGPQSAFFPPRSLRGGYGGLVVPPESGAGAGNAYVHGG